MGKSQHLKAFMAQQGPGLFITKAKSYTPLPTSWPFQLTNPWCSAGLTRRTTHFQVQEHCPSETVLWARKESEGRVEGSAHYSMVWKGDKPCAWARGTHPDHSPQRLLQDWPGHNRPTSQAVRSHEEGTRAVPKAISRVTGCSVSSPS